MCDYCGCRDLSPAIAELSDEHERILDAVYQLRRAAAAGDIHAARMVAAGLEPLLELHTAKEEQGLFAQLREAWGTDDRLDTLVDEHRLVDRQLAEVVAGGDGWPDVAVAVAAALSRHLMDEETDLFPYAQYELSPLQWDEVERVHARVGSVAASAA